MHSTLTTDIEQFPIHVPQGALDDLRTRLALTRWPGIETVTDTSQGPTTGAIRALTSYWAETYDWRRAEALLNGMGSHRITIDGLDIHFLHVRSPEADALPLLMTHGWPSSVLDFAKTVGPLTDPAAHGGDPRQAFHLGDPVPAGLRVLRPARHHRLGLPPDRRRLDHPDGPARLRPLGRPRR
jgi:epoxide hydrolase-like protein